VLLNKEASFGCCIAGWIIGEKYFLAKVEIVKKAVVKIKSFG